MPSNCEIFTADGVFYIIYRNNNVYISVSHCQTGEQALYY